MRPSTSAERPAASSFSHERPADLLDVRGRRLAPFRHLVEERPVRVGLEVLEGEVLQLVLDLAHAETAGEGRVDVHRLARDAGAPLVGQVLQRPHVVQAVGELHQDHTYVVDHGEQQLAEVLRLALLGGGERDLADLGHALDDVEHVLAEVLLDALGLRERVLEHVVQEADRDAGRIHPHVGQDGRHLERMHEVGFTRGSRLAFVLDRREDVRLAQQLEIRPRMVAADGFVDVFEADHGQMVPGRPFSLGRSREASNAGREGSRNLDLTSGVCL